MQRLVAVAASGGRDSTALLHATCRAARPLGIQVVALHVHHGLMPEADAWRAHVEAQVARWRRAGWPVRCRSHRIASRPAPGDSIEAWARRERYAALAAMAREEGAGLILLAQHRRDQAETFLLQALRGAGPAGLSAMPRSALREGLTWSRPWLDMPRAAIDTYVQRHRLSHVEDASNADPRFARSRLRTAVWPVLERSFPDAERVLSRAAFRAQEASACLQELADEDLVRIGAVEGQLTLKAWLDLNAARRANALRRWLSGLLQGDVPQSLVERLLVEAPSARSGSAWPTPAGQLRLQRGVLLAPRPSTQAMVIGGPVTAIDLSVPGMHAVAGWRGSWQVRPAAGPGLPAAALRTAELRPRSGAERFQRADGSPPRSLKKSFQSMGIAAVDRGGPLVYIDGQLAFVPGLGADARMRVTTAEAVQLVWLPDD
jgi:tRNA(Ile)-lysidine synthase